ncbi:hypothetical protein HYPSUDRAFT_207487 [Hypholoma sublateritium FD-334 SS-4]|uniref:DUF6533 domain-containing protein n=1 Tax=Hypholoma sublateritium (strain FD-334 SS-4) TaxID=945553 RepID=A0A0D2NGU3_HYPSF|nr:hypothetical protein HYPSUDRAFT_207487 [Hypholoma sublateritium FD-334 SS-4]
MESEDTFFRQHATTCAYIGVGGLVFLFYDHLLTFADEVQYIWNAKHSFPKFLFLLVRYLVPAALIVHLYQLTGSVWKDDNADMIWFNLAVCLGIFCMAIGNFFVLLRLWVLCKRNTTVIAYTLVLFVSAQAGVIACAIVVLCGVTPSLSFDPFYKMCALQKRSILGALYLPPAILDAVSLLAVGWKATTAHPRTKNHIWRSLSTERFGYLLTLFLMRLINLGTTLFGPLHYVFLGLWYVPLHHARHLHNTPPKDPIADRTVFLFFMHSVIWAATTVTVSRLILDLRKNGVTAASAPDTLPPPMYLASLDSGILHHRAAASRPMYNTNPPSPINA